MLYGGRNISLLQSQSDITHTMKRKYNQHGKDTKQEVERFPRFWESKINIKIHIGEEHKENKTTKPILPM